MNITETNRNNGTTCAKRAATPEEVNYYNNMLSNLAATMERERAAGICTNTGMRMEFGVRRR